MTDRLLSRIGRLPGTAPPKTKVKLTGHDAAMNQWEVNLPRLLDAMKAASAENGRPFTFQELNTILKRSPPKGLPPLRKRSLLQSEGYIRSLGDGTWEIISSTP